MTTLPPPYYQCGDVTIYNADCLDLLPLLPKVDCVITDPPYGIGFKGESWDVKMPELVVSLCSLYPKVAIIMAPVEAFKLPTPKWVACWARPASSSRSLVGGFNHWSPILLYGNIKLSVDFKSWHAIANAYQTDFGHPSPKPECLMEWLVSELTTKQETILDPFLGSGTTAIACLRTGRKCIGIELEPKYCRIAADRCDRELDQLQLFKPADLTQLQQSPLL